MLKVNRPTKDSLNTTEIIAVKELVKSLVQISKKDPGICVMTGYIQQLKELRAWAFLREWNCITIYSFGTAQGRE